MKFKFQVELSFQVECLKTKCPDTPKYHLHTLKAFLVKYFPPTCLSFPANSLTFPTTLQQLLLIGFTLHFSNPSVNLKKILTLAQNHNLVQLTLFLTLRLYVRTFSVLWKKLQIWNISVLQFIMEYHISLSMVLNPCFTSPIFWQFLYIYILLIQYQY